MMTLKQFGQSIKLKYPQYKDMDDEEVGKKVIAKYPQYQSQVKVKQSTQELQKKMELERAAGQRASDTLKSPFKQFQEGFKNEPIMAPVRVAGAIGTDILRTLATAPVRVAQAGQALMGKTPQEANLGALGTISATPTTGQVLGGGLKTVSLGLGPILGGAGYAGGAAMEEKQGLLPTLGATALGGVGGKVFSKILPGVGETSLSKELGEVSKGLTQNFTQGVQTKLRQVETNSLANEWRAAAESTKKTNKALNKSLRLGRDPAQILGERGIVPEVRDGRMYTTKVADQLNESVIPLNQHLDLALREVQKTMPLIEIKLLREKAIAKINAMPRLTENDRQAMINNVNNEIDLQIKKRGLALKLEDFNDIKQSMWSASARKFDSTNPFKADSNTTLGQVAKEIIEEKSKGVLEVEELNKEIGKVYEAEKMLRLLDGNTLKHGRTGKIIFGFLGSQIARSTGIPGSEIVGYLAGDAVMDILQKNAFSNPLKQLILRNIKVNNPAAYEQILKYLQQTSEQNLSRLRLGGQQGIPMPPAQDTSGVIRGVAPGQQILPKEFPALPAPKEFNIVNQGRPISVAPSGFKGEFTRKDLVATSPLLKKNESKPISITNPSISISPEKLKQLSNRNYSGGQGVQSVEKVIEATKNSKYKTTVIHTTTPEAKTQILKNGFSLDESGKGKGWELGENDPLGVYFHPSKAAFTNYAKYMAETPELVKGPQISAKLELNNPLKLTSKQQWDDIVSQIEKQYVYHTTSKQNLVGILKEGLRPSTGQYGKAVYVAPSIKETGGFGSQEGVMIRIKREKLPSDFQEFPEQGFTSKTISPENLEYSLDNGKNWLNNKEIKISQNKAVTEYLKSQGYDGIIDKDGFISQMDEGQIVVFDPKQVHIIKEESIPSLKAFNNKSSIKSESKITKEELLTQKLKELKSEYKRRDKIDAEEFERQILKKGKPTMSYDEYSANNHRLFNLDKEIKAIKSQIDPTFKQKLNDEKLKEDSGNWLSGWSEGESLHTGISQKNPSKEIIDYLEREQIKPQKDITLYRGITPGQKETSDKFSGWTKYKKVAEGYIEDEEGNKGKIITRVFKPKEILVDVDRAMKKLEGDSDFIGEGEMIVYPIKSIPSLKAFTGLENLSTKLIEKLKGRTTTSKQFIEDLTKSPDLKQVEKDLIKNILAQEKGDSIVISDFAKKVQAELLPLKIKNIKERSPLGESNIRHEGIALPDDLRGNVASYNEHIYESPIKTSAGSLHFGNQSKNYFGHTRVEDMADESSLWNKIGKNNTDYYNAKKADNKIISGDTRRVIEVQSDLYQKGGLERESTTANFRNEQVVELEKKIARAYNKPELQEARTKWIKERDQILEGYKSNTLSKLNQYNDPTAHFRMVREEIAQAAKDGKTKLQFPTGETAMKIEKLGVDEGSWSYSENGKYIDNLRPTNMKVGMQITQEGPGASDESWIITDVLGDGKFKAVQKEMIERFKGNIKDAIEGGNQETFDISGKADTSNPIYKFYEKDLGKYLKNRHGAQLVTDKQGVTWWELPITKEMGKSPVEAFGFGLLPLLKSKKEEE